MSLITNFNFRSYESDLSRHSVETKEGVSLSLLTSREMERMATVEVKVRCTKEVSGAPFRPLVQRGVELPTFWDARMGNFDVKGFDKVPCATCARSTSGGGRGLHPRCEGHYGLIRMPQIGESSRERLVVYNPHTMKDMLSLLASQCFFCHQFRAMDWDLVRFECALELLDAGLTGEGLHFLDTFGPSKSTRAAQLKRPRNVDETQSVFDTREMRDYVAEKIESYYGDRPRPDRRSLYGIVDVRNEVVARALRELKEYGDTCSRCGAVSPNITERGGQLFIKFNSRAMELNMSSGKLSQQQVDEWRAENQQMKRERTLIYANNFVEPMRKLCQENVTLIQRLFPMVGGATVDVENPRPLDPAQLHRVFFLDCMLVPPMPLRLNSGIQVMNGNISPDETTRNLSQVLAFAEEIQQFYHLYRQNNTTPSQHVANDQNIRSLQLKVNEAYETIMGSFAKKQGLFRMNMMGKRVNQACRSVISPDFTVEPNEVLLPRPFARNLSFPEQIAFISPARVDFLKRCVINGATKYPGASNIEVRHDSGRVEIIDLANTTSRQREGIAEKQFAVAQSGHARVVVHRHVVNDDRLIFNRQPTLHKLSMMGYKAKVLSGLKTLRFHYVNGKSYNADFDGDEMNVHVPQSLQCRAELDTIMDANLQYLVPTSGKPLRGLIQDHIAAGVLLTMRDRFFERDSFVQLLYSGLHPYLGPTDDFAQMIPIPAILMPKPLWTGKQLVSAICKFVTGVFRGRHGASVRGPTLVPGNAWSSFDYPRSFKQDALNGDAQVVFLSSELLAGVLDKNQLGPAPMSLAHVMHEVYGPHAVGRFFGAIGRILTYSLQREGYSFGMDDMLLLDPAGRRKEIREIDLCGVGLDEAQAMPIIGDKTSKFQKQFMNSKLRVPFPVNQLIMMTISGAKGSQTNANQMALGLGQQMFDGKRVKRMPSGKTLPCFFTGESRTRSFGYAMGRFASGIRPGEYTIHAMAGRDGLIDTAVKTSRSGHLQRCLIKGLESLTVAWDGTVRDGDGGVVQFRYGYDGLDPCRASTLASFDMVNQNTTDMATKFGVTDLPNGSSQDVTGRTASTFNENAKRMLDAASDSDDSDGELPPPALPRHLQNALDKFVSKSAGQHRNPKRLAKWHKKYAGNLDVVRDKIEESDRLEREQTRDIVTRITQGKLDRARADPGEPVGLLAAQAAGEPSTQMTLNTFHQAGQTVSHVAEGIPRLRELLIHASVKNGAVVVPVEGARAEDYLTINKILSAVTPILLKETLARIPTPYKYQVTRGEATTTLRIAFVFSKTLLEDAKHRMSCTDEQHVRLFSDCLKLFARKLCNLLRGKQVQRANKTDKEDTFDPITDPATMTTGDADDTRGIKDGKDSDDESDNDDIDSRVDSEAPLTAFKSRARKAAGYGSDESDDDEVPADVEDEEEEEVQETKGSRGTSDYRKFPSVRSTYAAGKINVKINPRTEGIPASAPANAKDNAVMVDMTIGMPANIVTVIPDAITACLEEIAFPTDIPQFEAARFSQSKDDPTGGELVFHGKGVTLKNVMNVLSVFAYDADCVKIYRAVSTDIDDMAVTFGIEAAYQALYTELQKLFKRYSVDHRHLSLIADQATNRGTWENYNHTGIVTHSSSPLFQMTFASSKKFITTAVSRGVGDDLTSLSAAIMVGEKPRVGTATVGCFLDPTVLGEVRERES